MRFRTGELKNRVSLYTMTTTIDFGQEKKTPSLVGTYWAKVVKQGGGESRNVDQVQAVGTYIVTMRNVATINPKDQLLFGSTKLEIIDVNLDLEDKNGYTLTCKAV